jgi:hypothetical protein
VAISENHRFSGRHRRFSGTRKSQPTFRVPEFRVEVKVSSTSAETWRAPRTHTLNSYAEVPALKTAKKCLHDEILRRQLFGCLGGCCQCARCSEPFDTWARM